MSYTFPWQYVYPPSLAGVAVQVVDFLPKDAPDDPDVVDNVYGSGVIHESGVGSISVTVPDDAILPELYWIRTETGERLFCDSFDYRTDNPEAVSAAQAALLEAIAAVPGNPGQGSYRITVEVGLPAANVRLVQGIDERPGTTGADGTVTIPVDGGDWELTVTKHGYLSYMGAVENVTANRMVEVSLQAVDAGPQSPEGTVELTCLASDFGLEGANIDFTLSYVATGTMLIDGRFRGPSNKPTHTDEQGKVVFVLYPSSKLAANGISPATYRITSRSCNLNFTFTMPDSDASLALLYLAAQSD